MARKRWLIPLGALGVVFLCREIRHGSLRACRDNLTTFSAPSARWYDALFGFISDPLFDRLARELLAALSSPAGRVLDVGCGPGRLAARLASLAPDLQVVGLDISPGMVELARRRAASLGLSERVGFEEGDVASMPFATGEFDLVFSTLSMHHWPEVARGLGEIHRVLKPGGQAMIYDLDDTILRVLHHGAHISIEDAKEWFGGEGSENVLKLGPVPVVRRLHLCGR